MRSWFLCLLVGCVGFAANAAESGDRRRIGRLIYTVPEGFKAWNHHEGYDRLVPLGDAAWDQDTLGDEPVIAVLPGEVLAEDDATIQRRALELATAGFIDTEAGHTLEVMGWKPMVGTPNVRAMGLAVERDRRGNAGDFRLLLPVVKPVGGGRVWVQLLTAEAETQAGMQAVGGPVQAMVSGGTVLSARPDPSRRLEGTATPQPIAGLYTGSRLDQRLSPGYGHMMQVTLHMKHARYTLFPTGHFTRGVPEGGIAGFDPDAEATARADDTGTFTVAATPDAEGDRLITLRYASGEVDDLVLQENGAVQDGLIWMYPANVAPDGFTFDGGYTNSTYFSSGGGALPLSIFSSASSTTTFRRDGTWTRTSDSVTSATGSNIAVGTGRSPETEQGTYAIQGGELVMRDTTGKIVSRGVAEISEYTNDEKQVERELWFGNETIDTDTPLPAGVPPTSLFQPTAPRNPLE